MKKFLIGLLAASALATPACANPNPTAETNGAEANQAAAAAAAPARLPDADPAIWVVKDEDTTVYLFGTFHLLDGKTDWFNEEVKEAFDRSQELVVEVMLPENQAEVAQAMGPLIMKYAIDPKGRTLSSRLTPEQNRKFNEAMAAMGAPAGAFDKFEPWFASMSLSAVAAQKLGLKEEHGAEKVLTQAARQRNMRLGQVETLEGQLQILDSMPEDQQLAQLKEALDNLAEADTMLPRMLESWNKGDLDALDKVMNEGIGDYPEVRRVMLGARNEKWAEWIDQRMDKPGTVFMAVGAGHLAGPDSVQAFLAKRNIRSERVPAQSPSR